MDTVMEQRLMAKPATIPSAMLKKGMGMAILKGRTVRAELETRMARLQTSYPNRQSAHGSHVRARTLVNSALPTRIPPRLPPLGRQHQVPLNREVTVAARQVLLAGALARLTISCLIQPPSVTTSSLLAALKKDRSRSRSRSRSRRKMLSRRNLPHRLLTRTPHF